MNRAKPSLATSLRRAFVWPLALGLLLAGSSFPSALAQQQQQDDQPQQQPAGPPRNFELAAVIPIEGQIGYLTLTSLQRRLAIAQRKGADLVILHIDSPGGRVDLAMEMADFLEDIDWAHTVAYVSEDAISAATFVSLACDEIIMTTDARFGDAGMIFFDGDHWRFAEEKAVTALATRLRQLAEKHDRPGALAEALVDKDLEVFTYTNAQTGETRLLSEKEAESLPGQWKKGPLVRETQEGRFFETTGERAVALGLAEANVRDFKELRQRYGVVEDSVVRLEGSWIDVTVLILDNWFVTGLLFLVGIVCLYLELQSGGVGVFGILSAICFGLFFWSRFLSGTAGWLEVILFALGVLCVLLELFIIPGFGVAGITGFLLIVASIFMASQNGLIPSTSYEMQEASRTLGALVVAGLVSLGAMALLSRYFGSIPVLNNLMLQPPEAESASDGDPADDPTAALFELLGQTGTTRSPLRPAGKAQIGDQYLDVFADSGFIDAGVPIEVFDIRGNRVMVREVS